MRLVYLFFKQGLKSIFKYKIQFATIVILSFISSFYLVSIFSMDERISKLYNDVVKDSQKYDFVSSKTIANSTSSVTDTKDIFIQLNDFLNSDYVSSQMNDGSVKTGANFLLSTDDKKSESFLTKAFSSTTFKQIFYDQYLYPIGKIENKNIDSESANGVIAYSGNSLNPDTWNGKGDNGKYYELQNEYYYGQLGVFDTKFYMDKDNGENYYNPYRMSTINSFKETVGYQNDVNSSHDFTFRPFVSMTSTYLIYEFYSSLEESLKNNSINSNSPLIFQFFKNNKKDFVTLEKDISLMKNWYKFDDSKNYKGVNWQQDIAPINIYQTDNGNIDWFYTNSADRKYQGPNDKIWNYLYTTFSSLSYQIVNELFTFHKQAYNSINLTGDKTPFEIVDAFNKKFDGKDNQPRLMMYNANDKNHFYPLLGHSKKNLNSTVKSSDYDDSAFDYFSYCSFVNMMTDYEYIFGKPFFGQSSNDSASENTMLQYFKDSPIYSNLSSDTQWINDDSWKDYLDLTAINNDVNYGDSKQPICKSFVYGQSDLKQYDKNLSLGQKISTKNIYSFWNGMRGFTNPLEVSVDDANSPISKISRLSFNTNLNTLARVDTKSTFSSQRGGLNVSWKDIDITDTTGRGRNVFAMEKFHQDMAANITGVNYYLRQEGYLFDSKSGLTYRFVINDSDYSHEQNLKYIFGTVPKSKNQVVVNQQFLVKNNLHVGSNINIAGSPITISGCATDALSYYPLSDISVGNVDVKNTAIIYLTKGQLQFLVKNMQSTQLKMTNYYFYYSDNGQKLDKSKLNVFSALTTTDQDMLNVAQKIIKDNGKTNDSLGNNITSFAQTNWEKNYSIQPLFSSTLTRVVSIASTLIILLALFSVAFTIRKTIQGNKEQINYLKSLGVKPKELAFSYVGYSIVISCFSVPLGWLFGGLFQEYLVRLFMGYIATPLYQFLFDPKLLFSMIGIIFVLTFLFSIAIALFYNRKSVIKLNNIKVKNSNKHLLPKIKWLSKITGFNSMFEWKMVGRNKLSFGFTCFTVLVLTFLVGTLIFVPSMFQKSINDAEKFFKYKNQYVSEPPVSNIPLSSKGTNAWTGPSYLDKKTYEISPDSDLYNYVKTYYKGDNEASDSVSATSLLPQLTYTSDSALASQDLLNSILFSQDALYKSKSGSLISFIITNLLSRAANLNGCSLSMGEFQSYIDWILHSVNEPNSDKPFDKSSTGIQERISALSSVNSALQISLPSLLTKLISDSSINIDTTGDWKHILLNLLNSQLPNSFMNYLYNDNRVNQFNIGFNTEDYVPGEDTLSTTLETNIGDKKFDIDGLKNNQLVYNLDNVNKNNLFINDSNVLRQVKEMIQNPLQYNTNIVYNGQTIFDASNKTIYIPTVFNKTLYNTYKTGNDVISIKNNQLYFQNSLNFVSNILPNGAWVYDNRDAAEYQKENLSNDLNIQTNSWLDPYSLQSSKFIYQQQFQKLGNKINLKDKTNFFYEVYKGKDGNLKLRIRPYYNYNNVRLYFPVGSGETIGSLTKGMSNGSLKNEIKDDNSELSNQYGWYKENVPSSSVPDSVKKSWEAIATTTEKEKIENGSEEWIFINPYNAAYNAAYNPTQGDHYGGYSIDDLTNANMNNWMSECVSAGGSTALTIKKGSTLQNGIKVKLKNVGIVNTFDNEFAVADQDLINLLLGYNDNKYIPVSNLYYNSSKYTYNLDGLNIIAYSTNSMQNLINAFKENPYQFIYGYKSLFNNNGDKAIDYAEQNVWYNTKYSGLTEATGLTTGIKTYMNSGSTGVPLTSSYGWINQLNSEYTSVNLSSMRLGIKIAISNTVLSVSIFVITGVIAIASLMICIICDSFISNYSKFIIVMKTLGYRRHEVIRYVILPQMLVNTFSIIVGFLIAELITKVILMLFNNMNLQIPYVVIWWVPLVIITIVLLTYLGSFFISIFTTIRKKANTIFKQ